MAMMVASRFAVLSLDEDDDYSNRKKKSPTKKLVEGKSHNTTSIKSDSNFKKKKKNNLQVQEKKGRNKSSNSSEGGKKKKFMPLEQWEEWKQKDAKYVEGNYEDDLSKALLLSKLEYEEKKGVQDAVQRCEEQKKPKKNKKNQKPFNEPNNEEKKFSNENSIIGKSSQKNHDIDTQGKGKINRIQETIDDTEEKGRSIESFSQEALILAQYEDSLEKKDKEIVQLKEEIENLKEQLLGVRNRNKHLCLIIANSEMKDKAEVLMELERLQTVKDELSLEVDSLHAQLEQERSKVRALSGNDHKSKVKMIKDKKSVRFDPTVSVIG